MLGFPTRLALRVLVTAAKREVLDRQRADAAHKPLCLFINPLR
jgi:hypothetical protein